VLGAADVPVPAGGEAVYVTSTVNPERSCR